MIETRQALDPQMQLTGQRTTCPSLWCCMSHALVKDLELIQTTRQLTTLQRVDITSDARPLNILIAGEAVENVVVSLIADALPSDDG
jgi:hypothetical protein